VAYNGKHSGKAPALHLQEGMMARENFTPGMEEALELAILPP
jgi:hypothetical protein